MSQVSEQQLKWRKNGDPLHQNITKKKLLNFFFFFFKLQQGCCLNSTVYRLDKNRFRDRWKLSCPLVIKPAAQGTFHSALKPLAPPRSTTWPSPVDLQRPWNRRCAYRAPQTHFLPHKTLR